MGMALMAGFLVVRGREERGGTGALRAGFRLGALESGELELGGGLEELDRGEAPTEQVKLPYTVAMSDLAGVYDFKGNRPHPDWRGPEAFEVGMSWRLYHLTSGRGA
jgi:hypothetical protein